MIVSPHRQFRYVLASSVVQRHCRFLAEALYCLHQLPLARCLNKVLQFSATSYYTWSIVSCDAHIENLLLLKLFLFLRRQWHLILQKNRSVALKALNKRVDPFPDAVPTYIEGKLCLCVRYDSLNLYEYSAYGESYQSDRSPTHIRPFESGWIASRRDNALAETSQQDPPQARTTAGKEAFSPQAGI